MDSGIADRERSANDDLDRKMHILIQPIEVLHETLREVKDLKATKAQLKKMNLSKNEINMLKFLHRILASQLVAQEDYMWNENIVISGTPDTENENCIE